MSTEELTPQQATEAAQQIVANRKLAFSQTFNLESQSVIAVLEDLAAFCRAHETAFNPDPRIHAALEGRREVWLRIQNHLHLTSEQLWLLKARK